MSSANTILTSKICSIIRSSRIFYQHCFKPEFEKYDRTGSKIKCFNLLCCLYNIGNDDAFKSFDETLMNFIKDNGLRSEYYKVSKISIKTHLSNIATTEEIYIDFKNDDLTYWLEIIATFEYVYSLLHTNNVIKDIIMNLYSLIMKMKEINIGEANTLLNNKLYVEILYVLYDKHISEYVEVLNAKLNKTSHIQTTRDENYLKSLIDSFRYDTLNNDVFESHFPDMYIIKSILKDIISNESVNNSYELYKFVKTMEEFKDYVRENMLSQQDNSDDEYAQNML